MAADPPGCSLGVVGEHLHQVARGDRSRGFAFGQWSSATERAGSGIHVVRLRLSAQRPDRQLLTLVMLEGIELEEPHCVQVRHLVDLCLGQVFHALPQMLRHLRPQAVGVRVVAFVSHHILTDGVDVLQTKGIVNEAVQKVLAEGLTRLAVAEMGVSPGLVALVAEIGALEEVRNPPDATLREGDSHVGIRLQRLQVEPVGGTHRDRHRHGGDPGFDRRLRRCVRCRVTRADMQADRRVVLADGFPEGLPVRVVNAGQTLHGRVLVDGYRRAALGSDPFDLLQGGFHVPGWQNGAGNEAARL